MRSLTSPPASTRHRYIERNFRTSVTPNHSCNWNAKRERGIAACGPPLARVAVTPEADLPVSRNRRIDRNIEEGPIANRLLKIDLELIYS